MAYKYPYISDKKLYAAVMFACKMIRENGFFNKACEKAADYYNVDVDDVEKEVRRRQAAGQQGKQRGKMKWFIVCESVCDVPSSTLNVKKFWIKRGKNSDTASRRDMSYHEFCNMMENDVIRTVDVVGEYDTKKEALDHFKLGTIERYLQKQDKHLEIHCCIYTKEYMAQWNNIIRSFEVRMEAND